MRPLTVTRRGPAGAYTARMPPSSLSSGRSSTGAASSPATGAALPSCQATLVTSRTAIWPDNGDRCPAWTRRAADAPPLPIDGSEPSGAIEVEVIDLEKLDP